MNNIIIPLVIVLIITIIFIARENSLHNKILNGVWVGSDEFIVESEADSFILIIDNDKMAITVTIEGEEIENSISDVNISQSITSYLSGVKEYEVTGYEEGFLPENFTLKLDAVAGILVIEKDDSVYAVLVKENNI